MHGLSTLRRFHAHARHEVETLFACQPRQLSLDDLRTALVCAGLKTLGTLARRLNSSRRHNV